jgi:tyrosyl-tRNA synthetase
MSTSWGNVVNITDEPNDMFGKIMAISDDVMFLIAKFSSEMPMGEIEMMESAIKNGSMNPKDAKSKIAYAVVSMVHGAKVAQSASDAFSKVFSKKDFSGDLPKLTLKKIILAADAIVASQVVKSKSEAWRLIQQGAFRVNDREVKNPKEELVLSGGEILKIGKRHFFRVEVK